MTVNNYFCTTGFILLLAFSAHAQQSKQAAQQETPNAQSETSPPAKPAETPIQNADIQKPERGIQDNETAKNEGGGSKVTRAEKIQIGISAVMFLVVLWQTLIYIQQRNIMRKQVAHAQISERAYLGVTQIGLSPLVVGQVPVISGFIENFGRTPAYRVRAPGHITLEPAGKRTKSELVESRFPGANESPLGANSKRRITYEFPGPCTAIVKHQIESGQITVFFQMTIWYHDVWGNQQHSHVFHEWNPQIGAFMDRRERQYEEASQQT